MKTKHTPGPWTEQSQGRDLSYIHAKKDNFHVVLVASVETCGTVDVEFISEAEKQANARLIAACPELLEALEKIEVMLQSNKDAESDFLLTLIQPAIKKAKGDL